MADPRAMADSFLSSLAPPVTTHTHPFGSHAPHAYTASAGAASHPCGSFPPSAPHGPPPPPPPQQQKQPSSGADRASNGAIAPPHSHQGAPPPHASRGGRNPHDDAKEAAMRAARKEEQKQKDRREAERWALEQENEAKRKKKRLESIPAAEPSVLKRLEPGAFLAPYSFDNTLPDVPVDPKLLALTFNKSKFVRYRYDSSVEQAHQYELHAEPDLGITIDLVDPQAYDPLPGAELAEEDAELLSAAALGKALGEQQNSSSVIKQMRKEVTWLRKTPLMGNNLYDAIHKHKQDQMETKHVVRESRALALAKEQGKGERSFQQQIEAVEKTFEDAAALNASSLQHPTDPNLQCVSLLPVLPDFNCWSNTYVQLQFDFDPALEHIMDTEPKFDSSRVTRAVVKGFSQKEASEAPGQYVAYLLPKSDAADEDDRNAEEEVELEWVREYAYEVKREAEGDSYFLVVGEHEVAYNEFSSKIAATRKAFRRIHARPTSVSLTRREADDVEQEEQNLRRQRLMIEGPRLLTHKPV